MKTKNVILVIVLLLSSSVMIKGQLGFAIKGETANLTTSLSVNNDITISSFNYSNGKKWSVVSNKTGVCITYEEDNCKFEMLNNRVVFNDFDEEKTKEISAEIKKSDSKVAKLLLNIAKEKSKFKTKITFNKANKNKLELDRKLDKIKRSLDRVKTDLEVVRPQVKKALKESFKTGFSQMEDEQDLYKESSKIDDDFEFLKDKINILKDHIDALKEQNALNEKTNFSKNKTDDLLEKINEYITSYYWYFDGFCLLIFALMLFLNYKKNQRVQLILRTGFDQELTKEELSKKEQTEADKEENIEITDKDKRK